MGNKPAIVVEEAAVSEENSVSGDEETSDNADSTSSEEVVQSTAVICEESKEDEMYGEGVVNRAATGVVALMVFLVLGLLAIVFAILYPIALTILPSKK